MRTWIFRYLLIAGLSAAVTFAMFLWLAGEVTCGLPLCGLLVPEPVVVL